MLVQNYCTRTCDKRPDQPAVQLGDHSLTYAELESISNRIGRMLLEAGCRRRDRVALMIPKSPLGIASILGILKADCIYVPVDPESPAVRAGSIIDSAEPKTVLADESAAPLLIALAAAKADRKWRIGWLGKQDLVRAGLDPVFRYSDLQSAADTPLCSSNDNSDPAYIMFTSGSTGIPKGVVITHSNIYHFIDWAIAHFGIGPDDRLSGHTPLHFDLSTFDIFAALCSGAQLHLVPIELNLQPHGLARFIRTHELTQWFSVPAALNYMAKFDAVAPHDFPALRRVMWCGEVFPASGLRYWMARLPKASFTNLYGPTETTVASSYYTVRSVPPDNTPVPIGQACGGEQLFVLNADMKPVNAGETGELYIGGVGLSPGYWRQPDKSTAAFVRNPFHNDPGERLYKTGDLAKVDSDGMVCFLGRSDSQIKCRGYRIELGEVEAALNSVDALKESAVVAAATHGFESSVICCAYSPAPGVQVTPVQLRDLLRAKIPAYMLPSRWMQMEKLPRNANGKTDKTALKELFANHETLSSAEIR